MRKGHDFRHFLYTAISYKMQEGSVLHVNANQFRVLTDRQTDRHCSISSHFSTYSQLTFGSEKFQRRRRPIIGPICPAPVPICGNEPPEKIKFQVSVYCEVSAAKSVQWVLPVDPKVFPVDPKESGPICPDKGFAPTAAICWNPAKPSPESNSHLVYRCKNNQKQ
jgi:hypothetical protein